MPAASPRPREGPRRLLTGPASQNGAASRGWRTPERRSKQCGQVLQIMHTCLEAMDPRRSTSPRDIRCRVVVVVALKVNQKRRERSDRARSEMSPDKKNCDLALLRVLLTALITGFLRNVARPALD